MENLGGGSDGEREKLGLARIQCVEDVGIILVQRDLGLLAQFVLQILFHPLDSIHKILCGDGHVIARIDGGIHRGLQRFRHQAHGGQHPTARAHHKRDVHADGTMFHATPAHGTSAIQRIYHLGERVIVQLARVRQLRGGFAQKGAIAAVNGGNHIYLFARDVLGLLESSPKQTAGLAQSAVHA